jgi:hypothetical protein
MAAFTTIAAGVGLAATVGTTAMSFSNASKQGKLAAEAKAAADASMQKAKQALEINYQKEQAVKKEPYELEREAALAAGAQAIEAGVEAGQAAPTAGRVMLAQQDQQASIQGRMGQEMTAIDKSIINESSRLRDIGVQINLGEAEGAQLAARDAAEAQARATQQGMQGVTSAASQLAAMPSLYGSQEMIEPVTAEGLKPAGTASYQTPLPTASPNLLPSRFLNPNSRNIQSIQTAGFGPQPIYPYGIPKPVFNPFTSVGGTNNIFGY